MYGVAEEQISPGTRRLCKAWIRKAMDKRSSDLLGGGNEK